MTILRSQVADLASIYSKRVCISMQVLLAPWALFLTAPNSLDSQRVTSSTHSVGLPAASLPVSKNSPIVSLEAVLNNRQFYIFEDFLLTYALVKHPSETKIIAIEAHDLVSAHLQF